MDKDYSKLPSELKKLNQWVCAWNNSKCPMKAYELGAASSTNPETWSDFDTAVQSVNDENYDYIGFVFNDNGYVGIDIDVGFDEYGIMTPLCADIVGKCRSYTEKSKSGRGVHIFLKGTLPFDGRNNFAGVEIYKSKRFFITTGKEMLFPTIIENQEAIDYIVKTYFSETRQKKSTVKVEKIYSPVWQKPQKGHIPINPQYPEIKEGGRNISLLSVAGAMWTGGHSAKYVYRELLRANEQACKPPLSDREVMSIAESISRYER